MVNEIEEILRGYGQDTLGNRAELESELAGLTISVEDAAMREAASPSESHGITVYEELDQARAALVAEQDHSLSMETLVGSLRIQLAVSHEWANRADQERVRLWDRIVAMKAERAEDALDTEHERGGVTRAERAVIEEALEWATLRPLAAEEAKRCDEWPIYPRWVRAREALQSAAEAVRKERREAE